MAVAAAGNYSDDLHQSIIQRLAKLTTEDIHWLFQNPQALDAVMQGLGVESDEASMLHYILGQELMRREAGSGPWAHLSQEERMFLVNFHWRKHKMEKTIRELRTIADEADSAHKTLTQTNLVASSAGVVSAAMTILGVALSPVTAGERAEWDWVARPLPETPERHTEDCGSQIHSFVHSSDRL